MPVKVIGLMTIKDRAAFEDYRSKVGQTVALYGGTIAFRGMMKQLYWNELHCDSFDSFVEVSFPDKDAADRWAQSAEYRALLAVRGDAMNVTLFSVGA